MALYGCYSSLADFKTAIGITDTTDDARLLLILEAVSRAIDDYCGRHFSVRSETRYFTPARSDRLLIDDLLSVTTLKTDEDSDLDYDYTWDSGDYLLHPRNSYPKTEIKVHPNGDYSFPAGLVDSVEIAGPWGFGTGESAAPYEDSTTTTNEALDTTETGVDVASGTPLSAGMTILVESEQMYVRSVSSNTATVWRGVNGTTAAAHDTGKTVYIYRYPETVREATIAQTKLVYDARNAQGGMEAGAPSPSVTVSLHPFVRHLLDPLRRPSYG